MSEHGTRKWRRRLKWTALVLVVGYVGASWIAAGRLLTPKRRGPAQTPGHVGLPFEDCMLRSTDGVRLAGWIVDCKGARGTVLLFHGINASREAQRVRALHGAGFRTVAIDFRGHGKSGGDRTTFGHAESADVVACIRFAQQRWPREPLAAWGVSLGGAALCYAGKVAAELEAIILESVYSTIDRAWTNRLSLRVPTWLHPLAAGPRWMAFWRMGLSGDDLRPVDRIRELDGTPILVTTGENDRRAPKDDARALAQAVSSASVWIVPDADHGNVWRTGGSVYQRKVLDFLRRHCR